MAYFQTTDWLAKLQLVTDLETRKQEQTQNLKQKIRDTKKVIAGREPNPDDAPYRPRPPGGPPWPGYPKPMPPGGPPPQKLAGGPSFDIPGRKTTGLGSMKPGDVDRLKSGNPGASDKIDKEVKQIRLGINLPPV